MYQMMLPSWWRALPPTRWGPEIFTFSHRPRCSRTPRRPELGLQKNVGSQGSGMERERRRDPAPVTRCSAGIIST